MRYYIFLFLLVLFLPRFMLVSATSGLDITVACPYILFQGEKASWVVTVSYYGELYSPPTLVGALINAETGSSVLSFVKSDFTASSLTGVFVVSYSISSSFTSGFYSLVVRAFDDTKNFGPNAWVRGVGQAGFQISSKIASDATIQSIKDGIAEVKTSVRDLKVVIDEINPKIVSIRDNIVTLDTKIGEMKTTINAIHLRVVAYNDTFALINSDVRQSWIAINKIQTSILGLPAGVASKVVFPVTKEDWEYMRTLIYCVVGGFVALAGVVLYVAFGYRRQTMVLAQQTSAQGFPMMPGMSQPTMFPTPLQELPSSPVAEFLPIPEQPIIKERGEVERIVQLPGETVKELPVSIPKKEPVNSSSKQVIRKEEKTRKEVKSIDLGETVVWG